MKRTKAGLIEALTFTAAVLLYIWVFRFLAPWTLWLLVTSVAVSYKLHGETLDSFGLSPREFFRALADWRYLWIGALLGLALALQQRFGDPQLLARGALYFVWCGVQQTVYQNLVYRRIKSSLGPKPPPWLPSGVIFGLVHWPNPVLIPATALWARSRATCLTAGRVSWLSRSCSCCSRRCSTS